MSKHSEWSPELEAALAEPFPAEWVQQKKAGKGERASTISFVPWHRYVAKLNDLVGGGWSMGQPITLHVADKLVMGLPVTILGTTRINFGDEDDNEWAEILNKETGELEDKKTMYGSPATNAFAQAFKRTCALFGMGLDMYDKGKAQAAAVAQKAAGFSLDTPVGFGKHKDRTWASLLTDDDGRSYVKWAVGNLDKLSAPAKAALTAALEGNKAGPTDVVILQDLLNRAANVSAVTVEQCARVEAVIEAGESGPVAQAMKWLQDQMAKQAAKETVPF